MSFREKALPTIFHNRVIEAAVELQRQSKAKFDNAPDDLVRGSLFVLTHDAVTVHRSIGTLAEAGWPAPAAILLRTAMDLGISAMAIVHSTSPPMAAFRYFYAGFRRHSRDQGLSPATRKHMFDQIRKRIALLPTELRPAAIAVVKEKDRPYWYGQEFETPSTVLERFAPPGAAWVYSQLSGAAHGSFMGMRLYREEPDKISINPEPLGRRAFFADLSSSRLLVDLCDLRNTIEGLDCGPLVSALRGEINNAAKELLEVGVPKRA